MAFEDCTVCGKCAQSCPVQELTVVVDELQLVDNSSLWEAYTQNRENYVEWAEKATSKGGYIHPFVTGTGFEYVQGEVVPLGGKRAAQTGKEG